MKIGDRLQKNNNKLQNNKTILKKQIENSKFSICDIFVQSELLESFVKYAQNKRNIIFICNKSFDKLIIANYLQSKLIAENAVIIDEKDVNAKDLPGNINIFPNPEIHSILKIFEQTIYGMGSFIFGLNFGCFDKAIDKLKAVIALNYPNLTADNINILIEASNAILVYVEKNNDSLFSITNIEEVKQDNENIDTDIIPQSKNIKTDKETKTNAVQEKENRNEIAEQTKEIIEEDNEENLNSEKSTNENEIVEETVELKELEENSVSQEAEIPNILADDLPYEEEIDKKPNKYQILKERARQKKLAQRNEINQKV